MVAAAFDSWKVYERELLKQILPAFDDGMLVLADRGFFSYDLWKEAVASGAELLWRLKDDVEVPVLGWLPDKSYRSDPNPRVGAELIMTGRS